ncbi:MAG: YwaF family protein [Clostridia bacterium]|nr:YwaF family protein [Clostridia bacterium]
MREFFGFGGYQREIEGYFSLEHILYVTCFMIVMVTLAVIIGRRMRGRSDKEKNRVLIWAAILIDSFELFKIVLVCIRGADPLGWLYDLPLFLCSIQLITIPLAAFSKGRVKEASLDFVFIFGILGAVLGTYLAGNNYSSFPVVSFDNTVSAITHSISGFTSLYIVISGMESMKKKNIPITYAILLSFCVMAYVANVLLPYNYMFLMRGDGTPYDIIYNLVGGNPVIYPISVVVLFLIYIAAFNGVYHLFKNKIAERKAKISNMATDEVKEEVTV